MKIWHLTKTLSGGAGQYALRLSNALHAIGLESTVLFADGDAEYGSVKLTSSNSSIRRFLGRCFRSVSHRIARTPYHSLYSPEFYNSQHSINSDDVVHLHGLTGWIGFSGLRRIIPPGTRVFQTAHGPWDVSGGCVILAGSSCQAFKTNCNKCPALKQPWKLISRFELKAKCKFVSELKIRPIANGHWMANLIHESSIYRGIKHIPIVPPIIDDAYLKFDILDLRKDLNILPNDNVLCIGAHSLNDPYKGIPEFLQQLSLNKTLAKSVVLLIFGNGKLAIPDTLNVRILGNIMNSSYMARIYKTSNLFISPSKMESFGMTLIESQATGTSVVAFDVGGIRSATWPDHYCRLVPLCDWKLFMEVIQSGLSNPMTDFEQNNLRHWAFTSFSADYIASMQLNIYNSIVSH